VESKQLLEIPPVATPVPFIEEIPAPVVLQKTAEKQRLPVALCFPDTPPNISALPDFLQELNGAQTAFEFEVEAADAMAPLVEMAERDRHGIWPAEEVLAILQGIAKRTGARLVFCMTDRRIRDENQARIYYLADKTVSLFSTADPYWDWTQAKLKKALANHLAIALLEEISGLDIGGDEDDPDHPIHTVGYYNNQRSLEHIAGPMTITSATLKQLKKRRCLSKSQLAAIQHLLALEWPDETSQERMSAR
jgi:hypothetical protein